MADELPPASPTSETPPPRTTGGNFRWEPPTAEELQALMPGYTIEKILGRGGMGAVYRGVQTNLDRPVAIKILPPGVEKEDPSFAERFKSEARLMARLSNPAVVAVYDFGTNLGGQLYFAMEYVDGSDVSQMIAAQGKLPPEHALAITAHVCDALSAAHELGIVHRDIKPANVLLNIKGQVKVADFGLAKIEDPGQHGLTKTGYAMGTPDFVAPEALMLGTAVDGRADLYAVGVMLYQMLTGNIPRGAFKPASVLVPGLDPRFDPIILKAMQHDREERHQSAAELRRELDVILTVPFVRNDAPVSAAIPVAQVAQAPGQRSAAQKPQPRSAGAPTRQPSVKAGEGTRAPETPSKSKAPLLIGLGVAAAIGIGAFVMFGGKKPERQATTTAPDSTTQTSINIAPASLNNDGGRRPEFFPLPLPKRPSEAGKVIVWRLDGKPVDPTDPEAKIPEGLDDVVMLAAGQDGANPPAAHHLLALHSDGHISAWGGNAKGQAKPPANLTNIISVAATTAMSIALDATGHVIPWGESSKVNSMPHITEKVVSIGGSKGLGGILMTSGKVLAFGDPGIAKRVADSSSPLADRAISIASAGDFIAVLRDDGALFAMGNAVGVVDGREGNHPITEPRLTLPGFPEVNRFPLVAGTLPKLWVNNSTTDIWVSGFEKSPIRIRSELPGYVKNSSKFLLMRTLDLAGLEYIAQGEAAAALKFGSSWRFERASGASNIPYCESQAEGCLQLAFTKNHAFGIKPLSVIAAQKLAATPAAPVPAPAVMVPAAVPSAASNASRSETGGSKAPEPAPSSPSLPVSPSSDQKFPPGQWVKVFTKAEDLPRHLREPNSGVTYDQGVLKVSSSSTWLGLTPVTGMIRNVGLRAVLTSEDFRIRLRALEDQSYFSCTSKVLESWQRVSKEQPGNLKRIANYSAPKSAEPHLWEFAAVESRVVVRCDGKILANVINDQLSKGDAFIQHLAGTMRDIEVINLDGLTEAEALKIIGVDEKGNDTRGAALAAEKQAVEQAKVVDAASAIPELKALHEQFVKLQAERVTAPFEAEVAKLNAGYVGGIDRKITEEKAAGHLDGIIALEAEKKLIVDRPSGSNPNANELEARSTMPIPAEDAEGTTANLKALRGIYRTAYAKIEAARVVNLKALTDPLNLRLKQLESTLAQKDRVADAKVVREYREKLARAEGPPSAAAPPQTALGGPSAPPSGGKSAGASPSTSSQPKIPKPKDAFNEREAAEWALSFAGKGGASVTILIPGKGEQQIQSLAQLPKEKFLVRKLTAQPSQEADRDLITDQEATRLMGLEDVREIHLTGGKLSGLALRALAQMPTLEVLHFQGANLTAADLAALENAPFSDLYLPGFLLKDEAAMRVFSTLKNLRSLSLGDLINSEVIAAMPVLPKLDTFTSATNDRVLDDLLPLLPQKFPALQRIDLWAAIKIQGETLGSLKNLKDLRDLGLNYTQVDDAKLTAIADMKQIQALGISGTKVTDACIATLKTLKNLTTLGIFKTQITDAGLLQLAELRSLKTLNVRHPSDPPFGPPATGFTQAGVDAFQKKRPDVKVTR